MCKYNIKCRKVYNIQLQEVREENVEDQIKENLVVILFRLETKMKVMMREPIVETEEIQEHVSIEEIWVIEYLLLTILIFILVASIMMLMSDN